MSNNKAQKNKFQKNDSGSEIDFEEEMKKNQDLDMPNSLITKIIENAIGNNQIENNAKLAIIKSITSFIKLIIFQAEQKLKKNSGGASSTSINIVATTIIESIPGNDVAVSLESNSSNNNNNSNSKLKEKRLNFSSDNNNTSTIGTFADNSNKNKSNKNISNSVIDDKDIDGGGGGGSNDGDDIRLKEKLLVLTIALITIEQ
nr:1718_t:CDS:2 [Entrophospora candida]